MRLILFRRGVLVHRASGLLLAAALVASSCANGAGLADTVDIDFSQRVHRDVLAEPGSATSNSVDVPSGHLVVKLARETVTLYGSHNTVRFQQAESELESDGKNQVVWLDASQPDLSADEAREAIRNLVELTDATADWDQVDAFLNGRLSDYFDNRPSSVFMVAFWHDVVKRRFRLPLIVDF